MIGFDMDYTLALYHQDKLEQLSIELTLQQADREARLSRGDPQARLRPALGDPRPDGRSPARQRLQDGPPRHVGPLLPRLPRARPRRAPGDVPQREDQPLERSLRVDRHAVRSARGGDVHDARRLGRTAQTGTVDYDKLFGDIRTAIDEAHRDDTLKSVIKADLPAYIVKDPLLGETLHKFRSSGKKLFLLTNSLYDYTDVVMSYLLDGERKAYPSWRNYFDIVIVGGAKPAFFNELRPFVQIDPATNQPIATQRRDQAPVARQGLPGRQRRRVRADDRHQGRAGPLHRRPHLRRHPAAAQAAHVAHRDGAPGARARDRGQRAARGADPATSTCSIAATATSSRRSTTRRCGSRRSSGCSTTRRRAASLRVAARGGAQGDARERRLAARSRRA